MVTTSILANTVRPSVDHRLDDTAFGAGTFSWQDPVHSWKAGPGEVMTVEKIIYLFDYPDYIYCKAVSIKTPGIRNTF